ncbi:DUF1330 domain-containing protein [Mesorhizobium sp. 1B3]|uniref:DUF1330 domain-containing protein n=1 Tax=Mesorhizobium sp. 1B3 TaxID=3243599 RepID=UPI003D99FF6D
MSPDQLDGAQDRPTCAPSVVPSCQPNDFSARGSAKATMPAYLIGCLTLHNRDPTRAYSARFAAAIQWHGGQFLSEGAHSRCTKRRWSFPRVGSESGSVEGVRTFYFSDEHQRLQEIG